MNINYKYLQKGFLLLLLLCFLVIHTTEAQLDRGISFDVLSTEDGLSRSSVKTIVQDKKGFIWVGTSSGLNRYDGQSFTIFKYDPEDSTTITSNEIRTLYVDSKGFVWVGGGNGGVARYSYENDCFQRFVPDPNKPSLISDQVDDILEDDKGFVWFSTIDGISRYDPSTGKFLNIKANPEGFHALPNQYVKQVYQDKEGAYWVAHDAGISQMTLVGEDSVSFDNILYEQGRSNGLPSQYVKGIIEDSKGRTWVASDGGVSIFDRASRTFKTYAHDPSDPHSLANNYVKTMGIDAKGRLWVGADAGISVFDDEHKHFLHYQHEVGNPNSLSNDYVKDIFKDEVGTMWVSTDAGINIYDPSKYPFTLYKYESGNDKGLSSDCIYAIFEEGGWIWLGTNRGLNKLHRASGLVYSYQFKSNDPASIASNSVKSVYRDSYGILWIGTDNGLCRLVEEKEDKAIFKTYRNNPKDPNSLSNNSVVTLMEDQQRRLWIGTWGDGVNRYNRETDSFETMSTETALDGIKLYDSQVQFLLLDSRNTLWIGSVDLDTLNLSSGLIGNFGTSDTYRSMRQNTRPISILEDEDGVVWIGTGHGIIAYNPKTKNFEGYTVEDGLASNIIQAIEKDENGVLWVSTDKGISRFDIKNRKVHNFDDSDGLQKAEFNNMASFKNDKGEMFFGGLNGLNVFHPSSLQLNDRKPPVYITSLSIRNKLISPNNSEILETHISETPEIELNHDDTYIELEFVALNYRNAQKNQYAYMMENLQDEWIYTSAQRRDATFTNLNPGNYTFRVKASNNDGVWNEDGASLKIIVYPPWWDTIWAKGAFGTLAIILIYLFFRVRTQMLKRQKEELERLVDERTEELSEANQSLKERQEEVVVQNEELQQQSEEIAAQRDRIEQQHHALEDAYSDIKVVSEVGKDITGSFSIEKIFEEVYKDVNLLMDAPTFGIGVYDQYKGALEFTEIDGIGEAISHSSDALLTKQLMSVQCFEQSKSIIISHFTKEFPSYLKNDANAALNESVIYIPLISKEKTLGVLTVQSRKANAYQERHITILEMLASYTATALDNSDAYEVIKTKNELITDSIRYAQTIQQAILPQPDRLLESFKDYFVIYRPKDIVSGDFYWHLTIKDPHTHLKSQYIACVDCTGHGVPGAFMSMIGSRILNEILIEKGVRTPSDILELLDKSIRVALRQEETLEGAQRDGAVNDGMDLSLCLIENLGIGKTKVTFAGAKGALFCTKEGKVYRFAGDKRSIGGLQLNKSAFQNQEIILGSGDCLYLSTDGLMDQNGPPDNKKYGRERFMKILEQYTLEPLVAQKDAIEASLDHHQQDTEQRDDITIIGIRI